ncbi:MAG: NADPH:quinone reductase [Micromonosporaceae bacterium]
MEVVRYHRNGPAADVLELAELDTPRPAAGEVRVRLRLSAVNPTDVKLRTGGALGFPYQVPHHDGAGEIDAVGDGVDTARIGEPVWVYLAAFRRQHGTAAQWVCLPARQAVPLPGGIDLALGAVLGVPAMTAHWALFGDGPLDGATVLVAGGAGAVGHFAIELARRAGATVLATASTPEKIALAEAAGASTVADYRDPDAARLLRAAAPDGVHRVIEVDLGRNLALDQELLAPGGTVVTYAADGPDAVIPVRPWMILNAQLRFLLLYNAGADTLDAAASEITRALRDGALTPLPEHRFGLADAVAAHQAVEAHVTGKVLLELP